MTRHNDNRNNVVTEVASRQHHHRYSAPLLLRFASVLLVGFCLGSNYNSNWQVESDRALSAAATTTPTDATNLRSSQATAATTTSTATTINGVEKEKQQPRSITEIFKSTKTDKEWRHHYDRYYAGWFEPFRSKPGLAMAEIGAEQGYSLEAWAEYFELPQRIVGLAYGESATGVEERMIEQQQKNDGGAAADKNNAELLILRGDQSTKETMDKLCGMGPYDIIIDDGSHVPKHMTFSFFSLFKDCLKPGGLFVIEDLETNYWDVKWESFGYKLEGTGFGASPADSTIEKMKQFIDILARYQLHSPNLSIMDGDEAICSIEFGMNILAVKKCTLEEMRVRPGHLPKSRVDVATREKFVAEAKMTNPTMK